MWGSLIGIENLEEGDVIVQIIPAIDWKAAFIAGHPTHEEDFDIYTLPLVCWALVEDKERKRNLFGVTICSDGSMGLLRNESDFFEILGPGGDEAAMRERGYEKWKEWRANRQKPNS